MISGRGATQGARGCGHAGFVAADSVFVGAHGRRPYTSNASVPAVLVPRDFFDTLCSEGIEKRREGGRHPVGAIRESPLHHGLYPAFVFVYTVLAAVFTQHAADSAPVRFGAAFSMLSPQALTLLDT